MGKSPWMSDIKIVIHTYCAYNLGARGFATNLTTPSGILEVMHVQWHSPCILHCYVEGKLPFVV